MDLVVGEREGENEYFIDLDEFIEIETEEEYKMFQEHITFGGAYCVDQSCYPHFYLHKGSVLSFDSESDCFKCAIKRGKEKMETTTVYVKKSEVKAVTK